MGKDSELAQQSIQFSVGLVGYYAWLCEEKREYVIGKQIFRSGTSVGANIHEAIYASSRADFANKLQIALKEASETEYWFTILEVTGKLPAEFYPLKERCISLVRMLISTLKTLRGNINKAEQSKQE